MAKTKPKNDFWEDYQRITQSADIQYLVVYDTETTGVKKTDRIVQIGAVKLDPVSFKRIDELDKLCNPGIPMPPEASAINHITDDMLKDAESEEDVINEFLSFSENSLVIGYNSSFDNRMVAQSCARLGILFNKFEGRHLDLYGLCRNGEFGTIDRKLETLSKHFKLVPKETNFHNALFDVKMTANLLYYVIKHEEHIRDCVGVIKVPKVENAGVARKKAMDFLAGDCDPIVSEIMYWHKSELQKRVYINLNTSYNIGRSVYLDVVTGEIKAPTTTFLGTDEDLDKILTEANKLIKSVGETEMILIKKRIKNMRKGD